MVGNRSTAAVPQLIVSDLNFKFCCFVTKTDFVFFRSGVQLFLHHQDVSYYILVSRTHCPASGSKNVQHGHYDAMFQ